MATQSSEVKLCARWNHTDWCSALNCSNSRGKKPQLSFFTFPCDPVRCKTWIINCRRKDLQKRDIKRVCRKLKLCEEHFEASQFMNPAEKGIYKPRKRLIHSAIPTLFNIPSPSPQLAIHRQYVASRNTKFSLMQMNAYHPDNVLDGVEVGSGDGEIVHPSETSTSSQHNHTNAFNVNSTSLYSGSLNEKTSPHSATQISESNIESSLQLASTTPQEADRNVLSEEITNTESLDVTVEQLPETSDEFESLQSLSSRNSVSSNVTNNFTCNSTLSSTLAGIVSEGPPARINRQPTCYDNNMAKVQRFQCLLQSVKQKIYKAQRNLFCDQKKNKEVSLENFVKQGEIFFAGQPALTFFKSLVKMNTKMGESLSWTDEDKMLAMSIYNTNSTVYKILTKVFLLPEIHTFRQINPT